MRFLSELTWADKEIARIRGDIVHADLTAMSVDESLRMQSAALRASAYVWLAATLERTVRDSLRAAFREMSTLAISLHDLKLNLFSIICEPQFASAASKSKKKGWHPKTELLLRTVSADPALLSEHILPIDGRTIRGDHFDVIWLVLGMGSPCLPSALHRIALKDLADGRNEVAHGHIDPITFGRSKAPEDLRKLATRVDEIITHLLAELDRYIDNKEYLR